MINNGAVASRSAHKIHFVLMAVAAFLLYALGVLTLQQDRTGGWGVEGLGSIPAAVSHLVYGAPLGAFDSNVRLAFWTRGAISVQDVLANAAARSIAKGQVEITSFNGNGVGPNLFATLAMWLFGLNLFSLVLLYLVAVGISAFAFLWRYRDERSFIVSLYFLAVTVMLLTPLCVSPIGADQMPIGGGRYFSLAAFLPAFHILFELIDDSGVRRQRQAIADSLALFIQGFIFCAALLVRTSGSYLLGILVVVLIWQVVKRRTERKPLLPLTWKGAVVSAVFAFWTLFIVLALPEYVHAGRVFGVVWHRMFIGLSLHPDWPYGNLPEIFDCTTHIPEGLTYGGADKNAHCAWWAYPPNSTRPSDVAAMYDTEYEKVVRSAYFYVLTHYPRQVFETYFYVKSEYIRQALTDALVSLFRPDWAALTRGLLIAVVAQLVLFVSFVVSCAAAGLTAVNRRTLSFPVLFVVSLLPLYAAWATLWTVEDTVFLMLSCIALAVAFAVQSLNKIIERLLTKPYPGRPA